MLHLWLVFNYQKQKFLKAISIIISTLFWVSEDQFIYGFVLPQRTRVLVICQMKYRLDTLFCLKINDDNKTLTSPSKSFKLKVSCAVKLPLWGGTIAQCFRPGFESQADQLCFFDLLSNCVLHLSLRCEKKWKIPKKRLGLCAFIIFSQNLCYICICIVKGYEI